MTSGVLNRLPSKTMNAVVQIHAEFQRPGVQVRIIFKNVYVLVFLVLSGMDYIDLNILGDLNRSWPKEIKRRQWLISEESRRTSLKTSFVPPIRLPRLWAQIFCRAQCCADDNRAAILNGALHACQLHSCTCTILGFRYMKISVNSTGLSRGLCVFIRLLYFYGK
jgi:hypothetical protein